MEIYICDDSKSDLMRLMHHLKEYTMTLDMNVEIRSFFSGASMLATYESAVIKPSLVFLDIYMQNVDGISTAWALRKAGFTNGIIFTTSSTEHAMESYNVNALYYLQKPYDHDDFMNAINKCSSFFTEASKTYTISVHGKTLALSLKDIIYFETGRHVTLVHTLTDTFSFTKVLSEVCENLKFDSCFVPIGRSYLINRLYVKEVVESSIYMMNSAIIPIPVRLRDTIQKQLTQGNGQSL